MKSNVLVAMLMAMSLSQSASAESLADKKANGEATAKIAKEIERTNKLCGTEISGSIDFASWRVPEASGIGLGHCNFGLEQIQKVCADADGKKAVQEKIKSYVCKFEGKSDRKVVLGAGVLTYTADKKILLDDFVKAYLMKTL